MSLQKGDFVFIDYVGRVKESGEVFDTTSEETAKKEHLYKEGDTYESKMVVIGEGWVIKALDESLTSMEVGKPSVVEISPDKAFGDRDPEKVKRVPLKQLLAKEITPTLGARIEFGGKTATIRAVGAGRVLLDFNPALAGKTLIYDATVKKKLETTEEKIGALIHRRVPGMEQTRFEFTVTAKAVRIDMPEEAYYVEGIQLAKRGIALDIQRFFKDTATVTFIETFKAEPKKTESKAEEEKGTKKEKAAKTGKEIKQPEEAQAKT
jgi:peptidylprolyl isomerase